MQWRLFPTARSDFARLIAQKFAPGRLLLAHLVGLFLKVLSPLGTMEAMEFLMDKVHGTKTNQEFLQSMNR